LVLEDQAEARYPEKSIEVVNAAFPAINSHAVREIAPDPDRATPGKAEPW